MTYVSIEELSREAIGTLQLAEFFEGIVSDEETREAYREALPTLHSLVKDHPVVTQQWGDIDFFLGKAYYALNDLDTASRHFERAAHAPKGVSFHQSDEMNMPGAVYQRLGLVYWEQGKYQLAVQALDQALAKGPSQKADCWFLLAMCYAKLNSYEETIRCAREAARHGHSGAVQFLRSTGLI